MAFLKPIVWRGRRAWERRMREAERKIKKEMRRKVRVNANLVRNSARANISGQTDRETRKRSRGGNQLQNLTGTLRRKISVSVRVQGRVGALTIRAEIGPKGFPVGIYGRRHELGMGLPRRPFLEPAMKQNQERIFRELGLVFRVV